jgi:MFS family permease
MEFILRNIHKARAFGWLYVANLFVGFHFSSIEFINSSFLLSFMSRNEMGTLIAVSSALAVLALSLTTRMLARWGVYHTVLTAAVIDFGAVVGLATLARPNVLVVCFTLHILLFPILLFGLDVLLENRAVDETETGNVRGIFLTIGMLASLFSPMIAGLLVGTEGVYSRVYLLSALFLVPFVGVLFAHARDFVDPVYRLFSPFATLRRVIADRDILSIATGQFLMRFFFSWMVVYLPIYLHEYVGFSWPQIGLILFFMLIPYILVEWPAGLLADSTLGEKELLIAGFVLTALSTAFLVLPLGTNLILWASILFVSRIGTALIESMTETYFFKKVGGHDADLMSLFRIMRPLAYVVGPISATVLLMFIPLSYLWLILAGIMLCGVVTTLGLTDTK